jgi:unsaturated chondroitin disaccharide hydrolase
VGAGRVLIRAGLPTRTSFALPAGWALSYDVRGRHVERAGRRPARITLKGVSNLIISSADQALLLHRLAELHARLRPGQFPAGADVRDRLHVTGGRAWTSGFWAGSLWQAAALQRGPFRSWALSATLRHLGYERTPTHDVGFMYGQSSLNAYQAICARHSRGPCPRLKRSVIAAADELVHLADTNRKAGTIPTRPGGRQADTIVDSMMNTLILPWATRVTGRPVYAQLATRHARRVAALLVRRDGSTIQAVNFDRATGRVTSLATHQGMSATSTWSRGQAWALYGFAVDALSLRSKPLLRVAEKLARYVARRLPRNGVPLWDYDAPARGPVDVSAGMITAAGMFHLARACERLPGVCASPGQWRALGRRMLEAALAYASPRPPLGLLRGQELNEHAGPHWYNGGELIFGLSYGLEAVRLAEGG